MIKSKFCCDIPFIVNLKAKGETHLLDQYLALLRSFIEAGYEIVLEDFSGELRFAETVEELERVMRERLR